MERAGRFGLARIEWRIRGIHACMLGWRMISLLPPKAEEGGMQRNAILGHGDSLASHKVHAYRALTRNKRNTERTGKRIGPALRSSRTITTLTTTTTTTTTCMILCILYVV
mmetsp:Transcript_21167/g.58864  ORF Transcript_21167/g.58864 Transcript_21167/m.58864 type:complete len:111 (+) Transcript_21167:1298-1630(+)